jgi:hypothetical protein
MTWQPDYITGDELGSYARADASDDADWLALAATAVSREIDRFAGRQFGQATSARYYSARWSSARCALVADVDDLFADPSEVAVDAGPGTYTVVTDPVTWLPRNAAADGKPRIMAQLPASVTCVVVDGLRITAPWGWPAVPGTVRQAAFLQGSRMVMRRDSPFGIAGSPDAGSELRLLARLDPDVQVMLATFRHPRKRRAR